MHNFTFTIFFGLKLHGGHTVTMIRCKEVHHQTLGWLMG